MAVDPTSRTFSHKTNHLANWPSALAAIGVTSFLYLFPTAHTYTYIYMDVCMKIHMQHVYNKCTFITDPSPLASL
jgi:hypothetical protein